MTTYIQRHSLLARWIHGVHMVACLVLILSGAVVFVPAVAQAVGNNVVQAIRIGHRVFAAIFIVAPLVGMITSPKGFVHIAKGLFTKWDKDDYEFMKKFPKYMFAASKTHMPPQREVKSGQRLADGALIFSSVFIAISGAILWFGGSAISPELRRMALLVHDVCFLLILIVLTAHVYLGAGVFQPYRGLARLMFGNGRVTLEEARYHWGTWAEEELKSGKNVIVVKD